MWLPCEALVSLDGITAFLPPVAPLYVPHHHTQKQIKPPPPDFTPHFVIFALNDGIAYFLIRMLCCDLIPYNSVVLTIKWKIITTMTDIRVTSLIESYQRCLHEKPYVPSTTFGHATLGANGFATKLFIAFLFSDSDVGV
jgi:hypothetical protein